MGCTQLNLSHHTLPKHGHLRAQAQYVPQRLPPPQTTRLVGTWQEPRDMLTVTFFATIPSAFILVVLRMHAQHSNKQRPKFVTIQTSESLAVFLWIEPEQRPPHKLGTAGHARDNTSALADVCLKEGKQHRSRAHHSRGECTLGSSASRSCTAPRWAWSAAQRCRSSRP